MSSYKLKIQAETAGTKVISILRKFDPSLSIGEIACEVEEDMEREAEEDDHEEKKPRR